MASSEEEGRLRDIERWFRERNITLRYDTVGAEDDLEWVALMIPDDQAFGAVEGGGGRSKLAAAEGAQARRSAEESDTSAT